MFGKNMFGKLQEMKQQMEEIKKRLDTIHVSEEVEGGKVRVTCNGNKKVIDISIDDSVLSDKDELQDLIILCTNRALEKAEQVNEAEMKGVASSIMPNFPGM